MKKVYTKGQVIRDVVVLADVYVKDFDCGGNGKTIPVTFKGQYKNPMAKSFLRYVDGDINTVRNFK